VDSRECKGENEEKREGTRRMKKRIENGRRRQGGY
jgi:hypothetical protein